MNVYALPSFELSNVCVRIGLVTFNHVSSEYFSSAKQVAERFNILAHGVSGFRLIDMKRAVPVV
jgi:hypothetical protein